ncbi:MAG: glycosyltransferase [Clostridia bacterium]|nr:glycosyltransferase [Clostridia bacterium]
MTIDIICPLYNAEKYINNLHQNLKKQKDVEIKNINYILTKGNDNTEKILEQLDCKYEVIEKQEFSHSLTREKAAMKSNADVLVFITQDIIIEREDWLANLTKCIQNGECEASYSKQTCSNNTIEKYTRERNYTKESFIVSKDDIDNKGLQTFFFSDASSAIKRETFVKLNGYDGKNLPTNEDMYFAFKLITNGYKIKYCADSVVEHSHKFTLKQLYKRYYDTGVFLKQNSYLNKYKVNQTGGGMAIYILKRAIQDKNIPALIQFIPNMAARFIGMMMGKIS